MARFIFSFLLLIPVTSLVKADQVANSQDSFLILNKVFSELSPETREKLIALSMKMIEKNPELIKEALDVLVNTKKNDPKEKSIPTDLETENQITPEIDGEENKEKEIRARQKEMIQRSDADMQSRMPIFQNLKEISEKYKKFKIRAGDESTSKIKLYVFVSPLRPESRTFIQKILNPLVAYIGKNPGVLSLTIVDRPTSYENPEEVLKFSSWLWSQPDAYKFFLNVLQTSDEEFTKVFGHYKENIDKIIPQVFDQLKDHSTLWPEHVSVNKDWPAYVLGLEDISVKSGDLNFYVNVDSNPNPENLFKNLNELLSKNNLPLLNEAQS